MPADKTSRKPAVKKPAAKSSTQSPAKSPAKSAAKPAAKKSAPAKSPAPKTPAPKILVPEFTEAEIIDAEYTEPELPAAPDGPTGALVLITRRAADRLLAGHLWVYRSDIVEELPSAAGTISAGELVSVADQRGMPLGTAIYSTTSQITLRLISRTPQVSRAGYLSAVRHRLAAAFALRTQYIDNETDACRLVFSEADNLPGIVADRYADLIILQLLTQGTAQDDLRRVFTEVVRATPSLSGIATIIERPDPRIRELEQLALPSPAPLYSATPAAPVTATTFALNGLRFHYDADAGQKTGAFLDQRENYAAAAHHAVKGGRALDICTYQGGFALHLARVCDHVTGVDLSRPALEVAEKNLALNRSQISAEVDWVVASAFDLLRDYEAAGEKFSTIVLDPPAFAKTKRAAEGAMRGYKELNLRAFKMLHPGGSLITCSCSHHVPLADFADVVSAAAADAGRRVRLLEIRGAAPDHPAILTLPETSYLKCLITQVLE